MDTILRYMRDKEETLEHVIFECVHFTRERQKCNSTAGNIHGVENMIYRCVKMGRCGICAVNEVVIYRTNSVDS